MKKIIIFLFTVTTLAVNGQELNKRDSANILFKAKLLTASEYGIGNKENIIQDIDQQNAFFLETFYKKFVFVKIEFSQKYQRLNQSVSTLIRPCSYYLAFSISDSRFYKLGGFDVPDIDDFFQHLKWREEKVFDGISGNEVQEIDIYCLYDYFELSHKKRRKKGYSCFENCRDITKTEINTHGGNGSN